MLSQANLAELKVLQLCLQVRGYIIVSTNSLQISILFCFDSNLSKLREVYFKMIKIAALFHLRTALLCIMALKGSKQFKSIKQEVDNQQR